MPIRPQRRARDSLDRMSAAAERDTPNSEPHAAMRERGTCTMKHAGGEKAETPQGVHESSCSGTQTCNVQQCRESVHGTGGCVRANMRERERCSCAWRHRRSSRLQPLGRGLFRRLLCYPDHHTREYTSRAPAVLGGSMGWSIGGTFHISFMSSNSPLT